MIKAIIFDLDGVLLDNTSIVVEVFQEDAKRIGVRIPTKEEITGPFGLPWMDIVEKLLGKDEICKKIHREVWAEYENKMKLMPGTRKVLDALRQEKAIVTSKPGDTAERQIEDLLHYFKFMVTEEDTEEHKPHPRPLLKACDQLNIKPDEAVYIGDAMKDFQMAKNAGTNFIGILSGATSREEFEKAGTKRLIASLNELIEMSKTGFGA